MRWLAAIGILGWIGAVIVHPYPTNEPELSKHDQKICRLVKELAVITMDLRQGGTVKADTALGAPMDIFTYYLVEDAYRTEIEDDPLQQVKVAKKFGQKWHTRCKELTQ